MSDPAGFIDNSPLFKMLTEIVHEAPGLLGKAIGKGASFLGAAASGVGSVFGAVKDTAIGMSHSVSSSGPEIAQARTPGIAQEPVVARSTFDVPMAELGSFSAPTFGSGGISQGGRGIG